MSRCRENAGILFKRACDGQVWGQCAACQKPVCGLHSRRYEYGVICVSCLREQLKQPARRGSVAHLQDDPYFYWFFRSDRSFADPYGAEDYALFDSGEDDFGAADGGDFGNDWAGS